MKSILTAATLALSLIATSVMAQSPAAIQGSDVQMNAYKELGCYSYPGNYVDFGPYLYQALGYCQPLCVRQAKPYLAFVNGTNCLCGDSPPSNDDKVDDSKCNQKCRGFPDDKCGGINYYLAFNDGYLPGDNTGTVKITTPAQTAFKTQGPGSSTTTAGQTVYVTQSGTVQESVVVTDVAAASGPNKAAIAAGVVVGIIALAGIIGGIIFFIRHKKRKELEEERRRHETMSTFVSKGEKPPSTYSLSDSRLEPSVMFQRRQSDGSIADNQDYSRRILKVTNPDER